MFETILAQIEHAKRLYAINGDPLTKSAIVTLAACLAEEELDTQGAIAFKYIDKLRSAAVVLFSDPSFLEEPLICHWD